MKFDFNKTIYGKIASSFMQENLSELCTDKGGVQTGPFGSQLHQKDYVKIGTPIITVEHLGDNRILHSDTPFVSEQDCNRLSKFKLKKGDIVFSRVGSVDRRAIVRDEENGWLFSGRCLRVRPDTDKIDAEYLSYFFGLESFKSYVRSIAVGATMPSINTKILSSLPIFYPNINNQRKIAYILTTLDNKIKLNKKINKTLESIAQTIFKSWFVDFDPVHAKANASSEDEYDAIAKELGISREILDLFPSEFEESGLGLIPKGWSSLPFGDFLEKSIGGDWGKDLPDAQHIEKVRIIRGTDLPNLKICSIKDIPTRYVSPQKLNQRKLKDGDIVIEISGGTKNQPTGRSSYITNYMLNALGGVVEPASFCRLFRPINPKVGLFLGLHLKQIYDENKTWKYQNQSTGISNFQTTVFLNTELVINPSDAITDSFFSLVRPLIDMALPRENLVLENIKNTLLPKLLAGEIDVSNLNLEPEHD